MTPEEINEKVAVKLGWTYYSSNNTWGRPNAHPQENTSRLVPDFCRDIKAAWEVWAKMSKRYFLTLETEAGEFGCTIVGVWENDGLNVGWVIEDVYATTAPMAICEAYLKLKLGEP